MEAHPGPGPAALPSSALRSALVHLARELCAPLETLRAGVELARASGQSEVLDELCADLQNLTRDYFDYLAARAGSIEPRPAPLRLSRLADEAGGPNWSCRLEGRDAQVHADLDWSLRLLNLVAHLATSKSPRGNPPTPVLTIRALDHGWSIRLPLDADDGWRLPESEPFSRVRAGRGEPLDDPNDLALPLALTLLDRMRGRLVVEPGMPVELVLP
jgi:hypothetical protein